MQEECVKYKGVVLVYWAKTADLIDDYFVLNCKYQRFEKFFTEAHKLNECLVSSCTRGENKKINGPSSQTENKTANELKRE